jgi:outer membrane protein
MKKSLGFIKNITVLVFLTLTFSLNGFSQNIPARLNLNQCLEIALKNNANVQRSVITSENAHINLRQSRTDLLPDFSAGITHGLSQGRSIDPLTNTYVNREVAYASPGISGSLLLFNGLAMQNLIKKNSLLYEATKQEEQAAKDNLTIQVILAYLQVLTYQDIFNLAKTQQQTTAEQVERNETLNANGVISPADYYDLKGQYSTDKLNIVATSNTLENYKISLARLLNIPYSKDLQLEPLTADQFSLAYETGPEQVYQAATQNLALVKAAELRTQSAVMQLRSVRAGYFPRVFFNTGLSSNYSNSARNAQNFPVPYFRQFNNNLSKSYSIGISIPIFNSFNTKNNISRARLALRENEVAAQSTRTQLQQDIEQAYLSMTAAKETYLSLNEQADAYAEAFRTVEIRFNAGVINSVVYLMAKNKLDKANMDILVNRYELILRRKILDFYQGKPPAL